MTLTGPPTPGQTEPGSDDNKEILCTRQTFWIDGPSPLDCLVSYLGNSLGESYPFAMKQSVYSTAPADWAKNSWYAAKID